MNHSEQHTNGLESGANKQEQNPEKALPHAGESGYATVGNTGGGNKGWDSAGSSGNDMGGNSEGQPAVENDAGSKPGAIENEK